MRVAAGELRHRLTFEKRKTKADGSPLQDDYGAVKLEYEDHATCWGKVEPLEGREYWEAQQASSEVEGRIKLRYRSDIDPTMRIKFGSRYFCILSIRHPLERGDVTTVLYKEALD